MRVLMAGPDRSVKGGISSVVNQYYAAGLDELCDLRYVPTVKSDNNVGKGLDFAKALLEFRRELPKADVIHLHASIRGSFKRKRRLARMAKDCGKPLVIHNHSGEFADYFEKGDDAYRAGMREFYGSADTVVVLSEEWREFFTRNVCDGEKIVVMHNAVKVPPLRVSECCTHQGVLFLGRLGARKSPDVLLRAAKNVLIGHPNVRFYFGGDGDVEKYSALAEELGIAGSCEFCGWVTGAKKAELLTSCGIYCLPSRHEGMPMSVLEAMSYGLATIATPVGGTPQIIKDGSNGLLVPVGDSGAVAARIDALLRDDELRTRMGAAGRETVLNDFNVDKNIGELMALYGRL